MRSRNRTRPGTHGRGGMYRLQLDGRGRVGIPAGLRNALGLHPGDQLVAEVEGDRLVLRHREAVEEELWAMFRGVEGSMAEELIAERRQEARRDAE